MHDAARMQDQRLNDIYDAMVIEVARLARAPGDRAALRHCLSDAVHHITHAIPFLDDPERRDAEVTWFAAHEAYLSVLGLAHCLRRLRDDGVTGTEPATAAVTAVLDALGPHVGAADRGLRAVVIDGEPLEAVAHRLMSA
jgi:hypothetical protein